jgi:hypothetical protein
MEAKHVRRISFAPHRCRAYHDIAQSTMKYFLTLSRVRENAAFSFCKRPKLYKNLTKNSKIRLVSDEKIALIYVIFLARRVGQSGDRTRTYRASYV